MDVYRRTPDYAGSRPSPFRRLGQLFMALILMGGFAAGLFLLLFRGYVAEGPDGLQLHPPLLKTGTQATEVSGTVSGITVTDVQSAPDQSPAPNPLQAVYLPLDSITDGSYEKVLPQNHCNAAIFDMKDAQGRLGFVSDHPLAIASGASAADPELNEAIRTMNQEDDLYTIARITCFRDDTLTAQRPDLALLRASGSPWRDKDGAPWLAPASGDVQSYLLDLCREAAALGFDEVLLTQCYYPTEGNLDEFSGTQYDSDAPETVLEDFYSEVRTLLQDQGVRLSILWMDTPVNEEGRPLSGQTLQGAVLGADRVWVLEAEKGAAQVFDPQRTGGSNDMVFVMTNPGDTASSWAICPQDF